MAGTPGDRLVRSAARAAAGSAAIALPSLEFGPPRVDPRSALFIVVGAHLRAEIGDRPLAYALRERVLRWRALGGPAEDAGGGRTLEPIVCTDVWYLNNDELRSSPAVAVGGPGVNAFSAYLGDKLPAALAVENVYVVQVDLDFDDLLACVWGMDHAATVSAMGAFMEKYLDAFLEAAQKAADRRALDADEPVDQEDDEDDELEPDFDDDDELDGPSLDDGEGDD